MTWHWAWEDGDGCGEDDCRDGDDNGDCYCDGGGGRESHQNPVAMDDEVNVLDSRCMKIFTNY